MLNLIDAHTMSDVPNERLVRFARRTHESSRTGRKSGDPPLWRRGNTFESANATRIKARENRGKAHDVRACASRAEESINNLPNAVRRRS